MSRRGQIRPMGEQAQAMLKKYLDLTSRHASKTEKGIRGNRSDGKIHSLATFKRYCNAVKKAGEYMHREHGLNRLKKMTPEQAQRYLEKRATEVSQKTLSNDKTALGFIVGADNLQPVKSTQSQELEPRAYSHEQVTAIMAHQSPRHALATRIAHEAGLRAHELHTLQRAHEASPSEHRQWSEQRFTGRDGERYVVIGKGGLRREVLLSHETARELEKHRLDQPQNIRDRGLNYKKFYDVAGGQAWSQNFSKTSRETLGWSTGAHGLRHGYVQERMSELQLSRFGYERAREIIAQEVGHFRGDITEAYLR